MAFMANHKKHTYLEPAHSVIRKFSGPDGRLGAGIDAVAAITGAHRSRVYRWMLPATSGGTGGIIPNPHPQSLVDYARKAGMPLGPEDFFYAARAA